MSTYLESVYDVYKRAAESPSIGLCCTTTPQWFLPGLTIPQKMAQMNYGCGSTVHPRDLTGNPMVLYVGVGGGMELLQFAYFTRRPGSVIGVDEVDEMLQACDDNLLSASRENNWFDRQFINLEKGNALDLPLADGTVNVAAQNCLFNIFKESELKKALSEMYRVLAPNGRLILSDPICELGMPEHLKDDEQLRALCLSGALPMKDYIKMITDTGFGTVEVRARRPYRVLDPRHYPITERIYIESVEICAIKDPVPEDGSCIFTGKAAIYHGDRDYYDDGKGHVLMQNQPLSVCDKTALNLSAKNPDILISQSTWFYDGGGCC
ncbi:MAG: arsenosugar biosynthesis arsenite methyltransferase ArsM [Cyclobacteriaceae bacterium]